MLRGKGDDKFRYGGVGLLGAKHLRRSDFDHSNLVKVKFNVL